MKNSIVDGKLLSGDRLMEINGIDVSDMTHEDVVQLIQQSNDVLHWTIERYSRLIDLRINIKVCLSFRRISNENFPMANDEQTSTVECQSLLSSPENSIAPTEPELSKVLYQIIEESTNVET